MYKMQDECHAYEKATESPKMRHKLGNGARSEGAEMITSVEANRVLSRLKILQL